MKNKWESDYGENKDRDSKVRKSVGNKQYMKVSADSNCFEEIIKEDD